MYGQLQRTLRGRICTHSPVRLLFFTQLILPYIWLKVCFLPVARLLSFPWSNMYAYFGFGNSPLLWILCCTAKRQSQRICNLWRSSPPAQHCQVSYLKQTIKENMRICMLQYNEPKPFILRSDFQQKLNGVSKSMCFGWICQMLQFTCTRNHCI